MVTAYRLIIIKTTTINFIYPTKVQSAVQTTSKIIHNKFKPIKQAGKYGEFRMFSDKCGGLKENTDCDSDIILVNV